jgi:dCTP deaminase
MPFWSSEKLHGEQARSALVTPFRATRVQQGAYELTLGPEYFVTADEHGQKQHRKQVLADGQHTVIPPGQFALLLTNEVVTIPKHAIGFISIKASIKFRGLVNVSGFHVDPGFSGRLKFAVYNAGSQPITLAQGQELFLVWFSDLDQTTEDFYRGAHQGQQGITAKDVMDIAGEISSPAELKREIQQLRTWLRWLSVGLAAVVTTVLLPLVVWFLQERLGAGKDSAAMIHQAAGPAPPSSSPGLQTSPESTPTITPAPANRVP